MAAGLRFNTAGPCFPDRHYMIPALRRLPEGPGLVEQGAYFVVHAPRQTGKTTAIRALAAELTATGRYAALAFSCEVGGSVGDDYRAAQQAILSAIKRGADGDLPLELRPPRWPDAADVSMLQDALTAWAEQCPRPLVLFFDEIDALTGQSLVNVLKQLRSGYHDQRPEQFPFSVVLCGLRDVRDYKAAAGGPERSDSASTQPDRLGTSSPFNIKLESLRLGDFTPDEVRELYGQHAAATGQVFGEGAVERAIELTAGQPWLVNALAREVVEKIGVPVEEPITVAHLERAKERLILARATHLDSLVARLREPRVHRVLGPILAGTLAGGDTYDDDVQYVRDLGLAAPTNPARIANPIYREVIARVLTGAIEPRVLIDEPRSFVRGDGRFDLDKMLREFAEFWREHGDVLVDGLTYHEVAPQLVLMAYLQRVVNGGGWVDREYGVGRGRIDLLVRWPYKDADGKRHCQREAIELKVWRDDQPDPLDKGLTQLDGYLNNLGLDTGVLVLFDRRTHIQPLAQRVHFDTATTPTGRPITVLRA